MRTSNLDDVRVLLGLRVERIAQQRDARDQDLVEHFDCGDVHRGREGVVRRLAAIDMIVRMDGCLRAHHAASDLDRAVRDDLIDVHVRLRARARLPDDEWEVVVELAGDNLIGGGDHHVGNVGWQLAKILVGAGGRLLQHTECANDRTIPVVRADADLKVVDRTLGLCTPIAVGGHVDFAHAVCLDSILRHGLPRWS